MHSLYTYRPSTCSFQPNRAGPSPHVEQAHENSSSKCIAECHSSVSHSFTCTCGQPTWNNSQWLTWLTSGAHFCELNMFVTDMYKMLTVFAELFLISKHLNMIDGVFQFKTAQLVTEWKNASGRGTLTSLRYTLCISICPGMPHQRNDIFPNKFYFIRFSSMNSDETQWIINWENIQCPLITYT